MDTAITQQSHWWISNEPRMLLTGGVHSRELSPTDMRDDEIIARISKTRTHQYLPSIAQSC